ncbi:MAG: GlmU family protein [Bacteroidales bacterium]|nr:GlmU family protein [Bacteroidales bacterium]
MNYILFDRPNTWQDLLPLTYTRPIAELRVGITTIREKWNYFLNAKVSFLTEDYLQEKFPLVLTKDNIFLNSSILPNANLISEINKLSAEFVLFAGDTIVACRTSKDFSKNLKNKDFSQFTVAQIDADFLKINFPWDIFSLNGEVLETDFLRLTAHRKSQLLSSSNNLINRENIFAEDGVEIEYATLNAQDSYIYLGKNTTVMEGAMVRGSLAMLEYSFLKMGAKIYGPTTIGPHSKVGGENNNVVITGYSNKAHDGFLGNAVIGEWCNLGADTNNSNLKNNYAEVKAWNYPLQRFIKTGLQFCGLIMGDHSKCAINTSFNTGTVVGVSANIFGAGFPRNFIPSFSWGGPQGTTEYGFNKAMEVAQIVMNRRQITLSEVEISLLKHVFDMTTGFRK